MSKKGKVSRENAVSGQFSKTTPKTTEREIAKFVKGFYEKNGKAMTQLAYE